MQCVVLHVDNSAVRNVAAKLGVGRLRHISGRLMWMQQLLRSKEIDIRQVSTVYNIADLNTKGLARERFFALLWMIGYVNGEGKVGETEYNQMQTKAMMKSQISVVNRVITSELGTNDAKLSNLSSISKQVLRVLATYSLLSMAECYSLDTVEDVLNEVVQGTEALSLWPTTMMGFAFIIGCILWFFIFCSMVPAESIEPEFELETLSQHQRFQEHGYYNEALVYGFISACIARVDVIRCSEQLSDETMLSTMDEKLMECFQVFERDGMNSSNVDELLELVKGFSEIDETFVNQHCAHQEFLLNGDEPDAEDCIPREMPEEYEWYEIPRPFEVNSPEHMAQFMIERLTRRLAGIVESGDIFKVKIYVERRRIMKGVINACRRSADQRRRALYMMNSITDISDSEGDVENPNGSPNSSSEQQTSM